MLCLPERIVRRLDAAHLDYWDAREERVSSTRVSKDNVREAIGTSSRGGFCIRVLRKGQWRSASFQSLGGVKASDLRFLEFDADGKTEIGEMKPWKCDRTFRVRANPEDVSIEEKTGLVRATFSKIKKLSTAVANVSVSYADSLEEKSFVNCEGSSLRYKAPVVWIFLQVFAREGSNLQWDFEASGALGVGFEFAERRFESAEETARGAVEMLNAVRAPLGKTPAILGPDVAGTLAHESFGHGLEADQVLRERSYLAPLLGEKVAGDSVRIVENPAYPKGFGTYPFDDEGVKPTRNVLVEEGILKGFIHSRETASRFGVKPTGNGRAEAFDKRIFVRMSNTYFEPGDWKLEEMIKEVRRGVLLDKAESGSEDPLGGNLQLIAHGGHLIENGELTKRVRSAALAGKVLKLLKGIEAEGKDFELRGGFCGKGHEDIVRNSVGGVPVLLKEAIVGGG
jgi:TldD protein